VQIAEDGVVLADAEDRVGGRDGLPDPVVVAVDVDAEEADFAGEAGCGDEVVDVVRGDEGLFDGQIVLPVEAVGLDGGEDVGAGVQDEAAPVVVLQERGVLETR
jgi:hypothetical protein